MIGICPNPACDYFSAEAPSHPTLARCLQCGSPLVCAHPLPALTAMLARAATAALANIGRE